MTAPPIRPALTGTERRVIGDAAAVMRAFDVAVSATVLVVSSPLLVGLAVAVRLESPGPVLYRSTRVGRDGVPFVLYKFRSMHWERRGGIGITRQGDSRVTRVGRWLRRTKLDELPQFVNVLLGHMALVGPRPEDPRYIDGYTGDQLWLLTVRPGITSPATLTFRYEEEILAQATGDLEDYYRRVVLPQKLDIDLAYFEQRSFRSDITVLLRTIERLLGRR